VTASSARVRAVMELLLLMAESVGEDDIDSKS